MLVWVPYVEILVGTFGPVPTPPWPSKAAEVVPVNPSLPWSRRQIVLSPWFNRGNQFFIPTNKGLKVGRQAQVIPDTISAMDHEAAVTFHHVISATGSSHCMRRIAIARVLTNKLADDMKAGMQHLQ
jgi:hypothetical protein